MVRCRSDWGFRQPPSVTCRYGVFFIVGIVFECVVLIDGDVHREEENPMISFQELITFYTAATFASAALILFGYILMKRGNL